MPRLIAFLVSLMLVSELAAVTRTAERFALDLAQANALSESGKSAEAARIYESLLKERPKDGGLNFRYAYALYLQSITPEFAGKKGDKLRKKALPHLKVARESGLENPLVADLLAHIKPDGSIERQKYSTVPEADAAMHEGEAAFNRRDLDAALAAYQRALVADPKLYRAALFCGDSFFYAGKMDDAIHWFQRAIEIHPHQQTAYRYWGDTLAKQGKIREALVQMSEAFIASPYDGMAWQTLRAVAGPAGRMRSFPAFKLPAAKVEWDAKKKQVQLSLNQKFTPFDIVYGMARVRWVESDFAKAFPNQAYRHSVAEEIAALEFLLTVAKELSTAEKPDPDHVKELENFKPTLELLTTLRDQGLLEPFVLFLCADNGIVQDYPTYRTAHRDKLREFVRRYLVNLD